MHLCQRFFQSSKHFSNSIFGIVSSFFSDALLMSYMAVKRRPFKVLFIYGNTKKSHGAMSGEYGGWGIVSDSWATSICCCFCSKFNNFGTNFAATRFIPKTFEKNIAWHKPIDMPTSSATSLIVIRRSFIIIHHFFHVFISCWCAGASGAFGIFNVFMAILETLIQLVNSCFTYSRLTIGLS